MALGIYFSSLPLFQLFDSKNLGAPPQTQALKRVFCRPQSQAGIPEYFPDPSAVPAAGVSRSDFSEAAAGSSKLFGIITSGTGTCEDQRGSCQRFPNIQKCHHSCHWAVASHLDFSSQSRDTWRLLQATAQPSNFRSTSLQCCILSSLFKTVFVGLCLHPDTQSLKLNVSM